jgi:TetR/AcrR family transcriptional regulator
MDNRAEILTQALTLFSERGYEAVGVQDIVTAARITKPTLYHYFGSKRGLLEAVLKEHSVQLSRQLEPAAAYEGDLPLTLTRVVRAMFQFARAEPRFYRMYLSMWFALPENEAHQTITPFYTGLVERIEQIFREAARDHGNMQGRHASYAATFLGIINTYINMALNGYFELDETAVKQTVHQFSHGIYS